MLDLGLQLDLTIRLVVAAFLGAAVGVERELHGHAAGMRTHLLVSMGSALFAVISGYGYDAIASPTAGIMADPTRIAAQVVSGIGFLGAGAIIHAGRWVRGLTTAASLWATAAVGLAAGAGLMLMAVVGTGIVMFSLGPLNALVNRWRHRSRHTVHVRLELVGLEALGRVTEVAVASGCEVGSLETRKLGKGRYEVGLSLRLPGRMSVSQFAGDALAIPGVDVVDSGNGSE